MMRVFHPRLMPHLIRKSSSCCPSQQVPLKPPITSFHKRVLPESLIALSSPSGRKIFKEALDSGGLECFFPLSEQFVTQSEPSFCSLSSLAMVLNALNHDPKRTWKGVWRWVSEETLQCETRDRCGHSLDRVKAEGMSFCEFESLAECHKVTMLSIRAQQNEDELEKFRAFVKYSCSAVTSDFFLICNFSRKYLQQTGDGHFSPIGGYHEKSDMVLILDVARFKYPPYWVPLRSLWESMAVLDAKTEKPRGYFIVSTKVEVDRENYFDALVQGAAKICLDDSTVIKNV